MLTVEELIKRVQELGIDVEDLLISAVSRVDPGEAIRLRLETAGKYLTEAGEYLERGDITQASEKAYKTAEEVVKALAEKYNMPEYQNALKEGRWYVYWLASVATRLSESLGDWIKEGWDSAYYLHVWGFHEGKVDAHIVNIRLRDVRKLVEEASKILKNVK